MKLNRFIVCGSMFLIIILVMSICVQAADYNDAISAMNGMTSDDGDPTSGKLGSIINAAIGVIQMVGTGISLIMVTILGIKYILAAPNDKADVKKQITPMLIGAIILFGSVNLVQLVADFAGTAFK